METSLACLFASCRHNCCTNIVCALCPRESWGCNAKPFLLSLLFKNAVFPFTFELPSRWIVTRWIHKRPLHSSLFIDIKFRCEVENVFSRAGFVNQRKAFYPSHFLSRSFYFSNNQSFKIFFPSSNTSISHEIRDRQVAWITMKSLNIGKPIANGEFLTVYRILDSQWR